MDGVVLNVELQPALGCLRHGRTRHIIAVMPGGWAGADEARGPVTVGHD